MKNLLFALLVLTTLVACDPEEIIPSPETVIPPKISVMRLTAYGETTTFSFQYNEDSTKLTSVSRNGEQFATLTYGTNEVVIKMALHLANVGLADSLIVKHTAAGYVDSIYTYTYPLAIGSRFDYYNSIKLPNGKLFSAQNDLERYMTTNGGRTNYFQVNLDTSSDNTLNIASDGIVFVNNVSFSDTLNYDLRRPNQPNLPEQFSNTKQYLSLGQGLPRLNPLFLLQQSNIYPHKSHTNLISSVKTRSRGSEGIISYDRTSIIQYDYRFDARSRVEEMTISDYYPEPIIYEFEYFD